MFFWIAQIFGFISFVFYNISFQCKSKVQLSIVTLIAQIFSIIQYFLLGGTFGAIIKIFSIMRSLLVVGKEKHKIKTHIPIFLVASAMAIAGFCSDQSILSIVAAFVSAGYALAWWFCDAQRIRYAAIIASTIWTIYDVLVGSIFGAIGDLIAIISAAIGVIRYRKKKRR